MKQLVLSNGQVTLLDDIDHLKYCVFGYYVTSGYATRSYRVNGVHKTIQLHYEIAKDMGLNLEGRRCDHVDLNPLNNQRSNLRVATYSQNQMHQGLRKDNTSGYKGIYQDKRDGRWDAFIRINKKRIYLGRFNTDIEAALAYDKAAKIHYREFAVLNFPNGAVL